MSGYYGYSMSNNAVSAYDDGEMPLSKWTKAEILDRCGDKMDILKFLTVSELRKNLLYKSSWHHTSCHYNCTDFYSFDDDSLEEIGSERVEEIIRNRPERHKKQHKKQPQKITALIEYTVWEGQYRNYKRPVKYTEKITYMDGDKMVKTNHGNKRFSSITVVQIINKE